MTGGSRPSQLARVAARVLASGSTAVDFVVDHETEGLTPWSRVANDAAASSADDAASPPAVTAPAIAAGAGPSAARGDGRFTALGTEDLAYVTWALEPVDYQMPRPAHFSKPPAEAEPGVGPGYVRGEFLYTQVGRIGTFVSTRASSVHRVRSPHVEIVSSPGDPAFKGRTVLNPAFIYEDARHLEVLLSVGSGEWDPSLAESYLTAIIVEQLAHAAVDPDIASDAPILFMHYPAAPFGLRSHEHGGVRLAVGASLRMSIALDETHPERRIAFLTMVAEIARKNGLDLRVGDTRDGRARGEWVQLRAANRETYRAAITAHFAGEHTSVSSVLPVTFVGPARAGSTHALVSMLRQREIGIVGVAIAALQEVAFINLLLTVRDDDHGQFGGKVTTVSEAVNLLTDRCSLGSPDRRHAMGDVIDTGKALGYRALIGHPSSLSLHGAGGASGEASGGSADRGRYALWIMWNLPEDISPYALFLALEEAARDARERVPVADLELRIEYARGRMMDDDMMRGRAKVSVVLGEVFGPGGVKRTLDDLSQYIEDRLRSLLSRKYRDDEPAHASDIGVRVEWRERWLGSWGPQG